jgi:hypothetical protein
LCSTVRPWRPRSLPRPPVERDRCSRDEERSPLRATAAERRLAAAQLEGGAFQNPLSALRRAGLIEYPQPRSACLTPAGRVLVTKPEVPARTAHLYARVIAILDGPRRRILEPLLRAYPRALTREALAQATGYEPTGGAFQNPLGPLRCLGLIEYPEKGKVVALPILFLKGQGR